MPPNPLYGAPNQQYNYNPHQQIGYIPQQQMPQQQMQFMSNDAAVQQLNNMQGVFIKQKLEKLEACTGCYESQNKYEIFEADYNGNQNKIKGPIMVAKESSGCCARHCCIGSARPLDLHIYDYQTFKSQRKPSAVSAILSAKKPYKCTFFCFNRPVLKVLNKQGQLIGKIKDEFSCCSLKFSIRDGLGNKIYKVEGTCCQCGFLCQGCGCKSCQEMSFNVSDHTGQYVGMVQKTSSGCCKACVGDVDNFSIGFPQNIPLDHKILLMYTLLMIDYSYFESKGEN